jgi:hypothetical protein
MQVRTCHAAMAVTAASIHWDDADDVTNEFNAIAS